MNETAQMQADRLLTEDRQARRAATLSEHELKNALAAIDREARERAAPFVAALVAIEAAKPPRILSDGWTLRGIESLTGGSLEDGTRGTVFAMRDGSLADWGARLRTETLPAAQDAIAARFGSAPYSAADQLRNALLEAFRDETDTTRARLRKVLAAASDRTLCRARAWLKCG